MITAAWGRAELVEEVVVPQSSDTKQFASPVQLLSNEEGEQLLRFAYSTDDIARRGPVTLRMADVKRLSKSLSKAPKLHALLTACVGGKKRADVG